MKWFSHDTDMHRNRKVRKLIRTHGATGYAFWVIVLEKLYAAEGNFQIIADSLWLEDLADDLKLGDDRAPIRILDTLAELNLISKQLWADRAIYAPSIAERGDTYISKRIQEREKKRKQRAKKPTLSQGDSEGTKGQSGVLSPSYTDTDPDLHSDPDPDPENRSRDQDPIEESDRVDFGKSEVPSDPTENQLAEVEAQTQDIGSDKKGAETDAKSEKPRRGRKSSGGALAATSVASPETFELWWRSYYEMCGFVDASAGSKKQALQEWLRNREIYESPHFQECDRAYAEQCGREFRVKGAVFGVAHGVRYLQSAKWQEALDRARLRQSSGMNLATPQTTKAAIAAAAKQAEFDRLRRKFEAEEAENCANF